MPLVCPQRLAVGPSSARFTGWVPVGEDTPNRAHGAARRRSVISGGLPECTDLVRGGEGARLLPGGHSPRCVEGVQGAPGGRRQ